MKLVLTVRLSLTVSKYPRLRTAFTRGLSNKKPAGEVRRLESGDHFRAGGVWEEYAEGGGFL